MGQQQHLPVAHLQGGDGRVDGRAHLAAAADVDVVALHEAGEVHLLQQRAPLPQGQDPLADLLGHHGAGPGELGALGRAGAGLVVDRRDLRVALLSRRRDLRRARRARGRDALGHLGHAPVVVPGDLGDDLEDDVGDRLGVDVGDGDHAGPLGAVVGGQLVPLGDVRVDDVDEAAVGLLLEAVQRRPGEGRVGEIVQPVAAQGEQRLIVVQPADLVVALPGAGQVEVHGDEGAGVRGGAAVLVAEQPGDEFPLGEVELLALHPRPAVLDDVELHRPLREQQVDVLLLAHLDEARGQGPGGLVGPGRGRAGHGAGPVRPVDDHDDVREVDDAFAVVARQVRAQAAPAPRCARSAPTAGRAG